METLYTVLLTVALGLLGLIAVSWRQLTYWRGKGIPYAKNVPFIGAFMDLIIQRKSPVDMMQDLYCDFPGAKYYGLFDGTYPAILIKDPDIIREVCVKNFDYFPNHRNFVSEDFDPLLSRNVFSLKDDRWREMRSTLTPSFTANKMKFIFTLVSECSLQFVQHLKDHQNLLVDFDMKDAFTRFTNDVIATSAFGISVNSMKDRDNEFYANGKVAVNFDFIRFVKFILSRTFPKLMRLMGLSFLPKKTERFFKKIVFDTVRVREERGIVRPDMIHMLMQARDSEKPSSNPITNEDIVAQAVVFFLGGFDTSSRLMCFASHVLSHHPEVQTQLYEEICAVLEEEEGSEITYDTLGKMKYLDMVVSETLRLYPPMPLFDRVSSKPFTLPPSMEGLKEFTVEADTTMWVSVIGLHRDPKYYPEPEKFDPERFGSENKNEIGPYTYVPFGLGPRKCIGDRFVLMETKILLVNLLRNFVFKSSPKTTKDITFQKGSFDMSPVKGFWMILEPRQ